MIFNWKNNIFEKLLKLNEFLFLFVLIYKFSPDEFKYQKLAWMHILLVEII